MTTDRDLINAHKLHRLFLLQEQRALDVLRAQRIKLENVTQRLNEQQQLISDLRAELDASHQMRSSGKINTLSASLLIAESAYRESLTRELDKEEFYLPGFQSDVSDAQADFARHQRVWRKSRERIKALEQQSSHRANETARKLIRQEESARDDGLTTGVSPYG